MIVPTNRLLAWVAVLLPVAAVAATVPAAAAPGAAAAILLAAIAVLDAVVGRWRLRGLAVLLPPVVRLARRQPGVIPLRIARGNARVRAIELALPLPAEFTIASDAVACLLPDEAPVARVELPCTPEARGRYRLERCTYQAPSPAGFWLVRGATPAACEIRVYPSLASDRRRLAAIFLNRGHAGAHAQRMLGQGRDFEKLREYLPGDSYDDIHWKATAKRGRPVTKLFQVERTQEIYVLVDHSRLSGRHAGGEAALEHSLRSALTLGLVAEQQGDLFGLATFSDRVTRFVRASGGQAHFQACRDALYRLQPEATTPDLAELFAFVRLRLRRRALLFILTDLSDPTLADSFVANVSLVCRQHMVLVQMIAPPGIGPLFDGPPPESLDNVYERLGGHLAWRRLRETAGRLHPQGVAFRVTDSQALSATIVSQYMGIKARQAL